MLVLVLVCMSACACAFACLSVCILPVHVILLAYGIKKMSLEQQ